MPTTKRATCGFLSARNIVELMLPLVLGILAAGMRIAAYKRIGMSQFLLPFRTSRSARNSTEYINRGIFPSPLAQLIFFP